MTECDYAILLSPYHDGEVPDSRRHDLEQHLPRCVTCTRDLGAIRRLTETFRTTDQPSLSPASMDRLHRLARERISASPPTLRIVKWMTAIAASVCLAASSWLLYQNAHRPADPTHPSTGVVNWKPADPSHAPGIPPSTTVPAPILPADPR